MNIYYKLVFVLYIVLVPAYAYSQDTWPVGSIIQSLLPEQDFQNTMGNEWVLMDGRVVSTSSDISQYLDGFRDQNGNLYLPDAQGKFLRMLDYRPQADKDIDGDPDPNRTPGSYQADELKSHNHVQIANVGTTWFNIYSRSGTWPSERDGNTFRTNTAETWPTANTGGAETRPRNIAVNFYIKINKCKSANCK